MNWTPTRVRYVSELNPRIPAWVTANPDLEVSFLPMESIGDDGTLLLAQKRRVQDVRNGYSFFQDGDIAFAKVTPCFENGKAAVLRGLTEGAGFGTTEITIVRPRAAVDRRFLFYVLTEDAFKQFGKASMTGAGGLKRVPDAFTRNHQFGLPSLEEQRDVVEFLDRETSQIDELISKQERLIELLAEKRQAIITRAITKGLDASAPTKPSGVPWLADIPAHWAVRKFNHAAEIKGGQVDPRIEPWASTLLIAPNHVESGTGRILYRQTASEQGADSGKYRVRKGEVIYSKIRPYLRKVVIAPVDCLCSADMYAITGRPGQMSNRFLQELMLSQPFTDFTADTSARVAMPKINRESLAQGFLWYPPMAEQEEVLNYIDRESNAINQIEQKASDFIRLLKERRSALISAAVTGKIDVREGTE